MKNLERLKIIQFHNNQLGFDCPCVLRASGKIEVHDESRMPNDEAELEQWKIEYDNYVDLGPQKETLIQLLKDADYHFSTHPPWPEDVEEWKKAVDQWRIQKESNVLVDIYPKPIFT